MTNFIYDESFCEVLEFVQYKAALAKTGVPQSTSRENIYPKLGLELPKSRGWCRRLSYIFKNNEGGSTKLSNKINS